MYLARWTIAAQTPHQYQTVTLQAPTASQDLIFGLMQSLHDAG